MNLINDTREQLREKRMALAKALPIPNMEPGLAYQTKEFTRLSKSGLLSRPNHLGEGLRNILE